MAAGRSPLGVVLTGGRGTRLQPLTPALPKSLVPICNRPLLAYGLDLLAGLGLDELVVVVGGEDTVTGPAAPALAPAGAEVAVAVQSTPRGPGDALSSVGSRLDGRDVVVLAVDTILLGAGLREQLVAFQRSGAMAWLPLARTDRPREMGIAEVGADDRLLSLEEKPREPRSNLACVGLWMLSAAAVERVRTRPVINAKGESDLTATVGALLAEGGDIRGRQFEGRWLDGGALAGLLEAQSVLLRESELPSPRPRPDLEIRPPVLLGRDCELASCRLGPNVVVGDGARLRDVTLSDAVVLPGAHLDGASLPGGRAERVIITAAGEVVPVP